ncbi:MAG: hypothetical protein LBK94_08845 [Prevotellaceae bacterium]|jgi:hypothetical protein|nr:hypothetical protein [Prevotellaceae bacterium]
MENLFSKTTSVIRRMIEKRISTNPLLVGDILPLHVKCLSNSTIWNCPESMIFSIINSYLHKIRSGMSEKDAVTEIEEEEFANYNLHLPATLAGYVQYRLNEEYPIFAYLYTDSLINDFYYIISN